MRTRVIIFVMIAVLLSGKHIYGTTPPKIEFFIGTVSLVTAGKTVPARVGLVLSPGSIVKTLDRSFVEIRMGSATTTIDENSTVPFADVIKRSNRQGMEAQSHGFSGIIKKVFNANTRINTVTRVIAVRADPVHDHTRWMADGSSDAPPVDEDAIINRIKKEYEGGRYQRALQLYRTEAGAVKKKRDVVEYLAGISFLRMCDYREASRTFARIADGSGDLRLRSEAMFNAGFAFFCMNDYTVSNKYLARYVRESSDDDTLPNAYLLRARNCIKLRDAERAKKDLMIIKDRFRGSEAYPEAIKLLEQL